MAATLRFEVPYELAGQTVRLVVDPHARRVIGVENDKGECLGQATPLDALANLTRVRRQTAPEPAPSTNRSGPNLVELAFLQYHDRPEA